MPSPARLPADAVAVIILNHNGRRHLDPCLQSVLTLDGLPGPEAVVVADNGSDDGSTDHVRAAYPGVRVISFGANLGFAGGNNRAADSVQAEHILFLNNDTRIAPDALARLWSVVAGGGAVCAGARLVSWDGRRLDFDGGGAAFTGHGHALGFGRPVPRAARSAPPAATLFASGAAMLVHRPTFLAVGGFDPDYFAYYEDVDLGWRLWLAGHSVVHVPAAVVRHRHHGTSGRWPAEWRVRLCERNAMATVVKNYEAANLRSILPAALALAACRAGAASPGDVIAGAVPMMPHVDRAGSAAGRMSPDVDREATGIVPTRHDVDRATSAIDLPLPPPDWAGWSYLAPLDLDWAALARARERVQALRRRQDDAILSLLAQPFAPVPATPAGAAALAEAVRVFDLEAIIGPRVAPDASPRLGRLMRHMRGGLSALARGGPAGLAAEVRRYRAWRHGRGWS